MSNHQEDRKNQNQPAGAQAKPKPSEPVLLDSRTLASARRGQAEVQQTRTPHVWMSEKPGVGLLTLQPGLNIVSGLLFEQYKVEETFAPMLSSGRVSVVKELPSDSFALLDLIGRTYSPEALEWIAAEVKKRNVDFEDGYAADNAAQAKAMLLDAVAKRTRKISPISIESSPLRGRRSNSPGANQAVAKAG